MATTDDRMTIVEARTLLSLSPEQFEFLSHGPFAPKDDQLDLRQVFGIGLVVQFGMMTPQDSISAAVTGAESARLDGEPGVLAIGWPTRSPVACWLPSGALPDDALQPLMLIPIDKMFAEFVRAAAALKAPPSWAMH